MKKTGSRPKPAKKRSFTPDDTRPGGEAARQAAEVQAIVSAMPHNFIETKEFGHKQPVAPPVGPTVELPSARAGASTLR